MNKIITIPFMLLCLTVTVSAVCDGPPDECEIEIINITHTRPWGDIGGDEILITVEFKNVGSKACCYQAQVFDMNHILLEVEPKIHWKWIDSGDVDEIKISSNFDKSWDICSLHGLVLGEGNATIEIIGVDTPNPISTPLECGVTLGGQPAGDDCRFTKPLIPDYTFKTPEFCCGPLEGRSCLGYGYSYGGFTCNNSVQINPNVSCLVECRYNFWRNNCSCALLDACAIKCVPLEKSYCAYDDFVCAGPYYRCGSGMEPETKCSTTNDCRYQCAAECGKMTNCMSDCEACCSLPNNCGKLNPFPYEKEEWEVCMQACRGVCRSNEKLCNVIFILQGVAASIAVLLIMMHGVKWITADDFEGRQDAKRGIVYVLMGLIVVMTAISLANYLFTGSLVC